MSGYDFEKIVSQARQIDEGIDKLTEAWKLPNIFMRRYGECTEEKQACADSILNSIRTTQDDVQRISSEIEKSTVSMDELFQEAKKTYEDLKDQCDDLESAFSDYSYNHYISKQTSNNTSPEIDIESNGDSEKQVETVIVELTPDLCWKQKKKIDRNLTTALTENCKSHTEMTPVQNLTSIIETPTPNARKQNAWHTPIREKPQHPLYSKHYYNALRK
ncbi:hypothetical protein KM043_011081 [Ampulex compressa]|nr:hypothetical protein KM043_011081 [Ampulex compressa]